jgi:predicted ribosomally synthesized peptide with SipW-like signal peptide
MTRRRKILVTLLVVMAVGTIAGPATYSAFSSTTTSSGNLFTAGTVNITDNDGSTALLSLSNARPNDSDTGCINITYTGTLDSTVRLHANVSGPLAQYLSLTVTRGIDSTPSFDNCGGFAADATDYIGAGNGVIYSGSLSAFPSSYAAGLVDPVAGSPETWSNPESHSYRFTITLQDVEAAQGLSGSASFTWEARNQ